MSELTTLELARKIADAVCAALAEGRHVHDWEDPPTRAVTRVLHETDSWFCRMQVDKDGDWIDDGVTDRYALVQQELF